MAQSRDQIPSLSEVRREDYVRIAAFRKALRKFLAFYELGTKETGVTPQQHQALLAVLANPDRDWVSVGEMADSLQLKPHATVELIDRCQDAGLLNRTQDPHDRRVVRVALTDKGQSILAEITAKNLAQLRALAPLTAALEELQRPS